MGKSTPSNIYAGTFNALINLLVVIEIEESKREEENKMLFF